MTQQRKIILYNPSLKQIAKNLRNNSTLSEVLLWKYLKNKQIKGYDFHRQKPIGNYIVDFFCNELMLALEIDGISHEEKDIYDKKRQKQLECLGIRFLRFNDKDIKNNINGVVEVIENWIDRNATHPRPSQEGNKSRS